MISGAVARALKPKSIAVVGATPDKSKFGGKILAALSKHGFPGRILPVNPKYQKVNELECYASIPEIPRTADIDLVLISVPRHRVAEVIRESGMRGIGTAIVYTSELGEQVQDLEMKPVLIEAKGEGAFVADALLTFRDDA